METTQEATTMRTKRLYRSLDESKLAGVCAGLGDYLGVDPVFVRVIWAIGTTITGFVPGILAYVFAWLIMPAEPRSAVVTPAAAPGEHSAL
jgi:phage shock protein PspC (stress-responsive transcriptional regulator)